MKKLSLFVVLLLSSFFSIAQQALLFSNNSTKKEVMIQSGDLVKLSYKGYLGQWEVKSGIVMSVQDSTIELSAPSSGGMNFGAVETRFIRVKDIMGFRKFHRSRPFLMSLSNIAITVGAVYMYYSIDKETNLNFGEKFGLSVGTGIVSTLLVRGIFPERIKNRIGNDWSIKVLK